jgi:hypothetical protein
MIRVTTAKCISPTGNIATATDFEFINQTTGR